MRRGTRPASDAAGLAALRQAEPVAGVVLEQGLDAVEALLRLAAKMHAARLQLRVRLATILRLKHAGAELPALDQLPQRRARLVVERGRLVDAHQHDVGLGLPFRRHREPAEVAQHLLGAHFEAELLGVEGLGALLVGDVDGGVAEFVDHGLSSRRHGSGWKVPGGKGSRRTLAVLALDAGGLLLRNGHLARRARVGPRISRGRARAGRGWARGSESRAERTARRGARARRRRRAARAGTRAASGPSRSRTWC